jgi:DNA-binding MarR family transcriptional regulator
MKLLSRPRERLELERFLPYRLSILANTVSSDLARVYARRFQLTIPEWRVMAVLGNFGPQTANEVCGRTAMDKVRVSRAVARLLAAGRLKRTEDAKDRRRATLALTAKGIAVHDQIVPLALRVETALVAALAPEERALFDRLVATLQARARALLTQDEPDQGS